MGANTTAWSYNLRTSLGVERHAERGQTSDTVRLLQKRQTEAHKSMACRRGCENISLQPRRALKSHSTSIPESDERIRA